MSFHVLRGDARHLPLADASVQCVVTSPPYFGLRDYGISGQLGLEPTPEEYVASMVGVFREVWRVLRPDGVVFLNLGDSYASGPGGHLGQTSTYRQLGGHHSFAKQAVDGGGRAPIAPGLKPKDLVGIPWRVAFALQADGWWLRSEIIWHKPNPMPESVTDRPTKAHEQVFLLSKAPRYYYDAEAVKENTDAEPDVRLRSSTFAKQGKVGNHHQGAPVLSIVGRNRRTVWTIATQPCALAHFATMPPDLAETCIKAGTSEKGCCPACGAPWERVVERAADNHVARMDRQIATGGAITGGVGRNFPDVTTTTLGFRPTCACPEREPVPCVVLDPFGGAGTTMLVADRLNRRGVGVELSGDYARMAYNRCYQDAPLLAFAQEALP